MMRPCPLQNSFLGSEQRFSSPTLLTAVERESRLLLVSRFWAENEERGLHVFWVAGSTELEQESSECSHGDTSLRSYCATTSEHEPSIFLLDVRDIALMSLHGGPRGPAQFSPVSSIGTLSTGEDYFVYRFALYWDGFEVQTGKAATGEGFYLICLNLSLAARSSSSAVRVLSLAPPGACADEILKSIFDDVLHGLTRGFVDYDADGRKRRIFLDLVGFLGDTPALNSFLDVLGHTSTACCHLCRYVRGSSTLIGSRYTAGHSHGMISHAMRTYFQHAAVRDCAAQAETCRILGMKAQVPSTTKVIYSLRERMFRARTAVPKTSTGQPVVPHYIDPYRACLIAPDHLLTGHLRDCISLALRLLPSQFYRQSCERFMTGFLADASLPIQNQLVDHSKKSLFGMSMSELYALSVIADEAFSAGCRYASENRHESKLISDKCGEDLRLVTSCSTLISELWYYPRMNTDGYRSVELFNRENGNEKTRRLQILVHRHLEKVTAVCRMSDSDVLELEDRHCPRQRKLELSKIMRETLAAIKAVDKPNLHRLRELVHTTLPLVGYVGRIGELVLEKAHQTLKRSIKQSNNR